ncbi:DUF6879 family protein [Phytomonospora endophytica]|uniref:DUF6879 domain-containing protein n=1 Tax=Phytomonospora endophytica TaxID=714109 RepID=A0A841FI26_9ACTN|nr:DUF6879 family protein [Phytomonospora endophytica]MBB6032309.1 hypothetical protein [Phytomonospora endophytica]GIG68657.1 hypothetical protein Pen01_49520 [Phytomonospora endophytica]
MSSPDPPRKYKSTILRKVLVTGIIGAFGFGLTELILPDGAWSWMASVFLGSVAFVTQFLTDVERRLDSVEYTYKTESTNAQKMIHKEFSQLNEASGLFERMEASALPNEEQLLLIQSMTRVSRAVDPLVYGLILERIMGLRTFVDELIHNRETTYDGEDRDWLLILTENSVQAVNAISLHTVDVGGRHFLLSDLGRRYIAEQAKAVKRGVHIRRIHVLDPHDPDEEILHEICQRQLEVGIDVRVLNPAKHDALIDFVLFDNQVSYETTPASQHTGDTDPVIVNTRLMNKPERLTKRVEDFEALWDDAVPFRRQIAAVRQPGETA